MNRIQFDMVCQSIRMVECLMNPLEVIIKDAESVDAELVEVPMSVAMNIAERFNNKIQRFQDAFGEDCLLSLMNQPLCEAINDAIVNKDVSAIIPMKLGKDLLVTLQKECITYKARLTDAQMALFRCESGDTLKKADDQECIDDDVFSSTSNCPVSLAVKNHYR